jgi:hypothetical protein
MIEAFQINSTEQVYVAGSEEQIARCSEGGLKMLGIETVEFGGRSLRWVEGSSDKFRFQLVGAFGKSLRSELTALCPKEPRILHRILLSEENGYNCEDERQKEMEAIVAEVIGKQIDSLA